MAGGKGSTFDNDWLKLIFQAVPIPNIADNAASSPLTQLWVSLHTSDPGAANFQNTNEAAYTGYARVAVPRNASSWIVTGNIVSPAAAISFPKCTGGQETETWAAAGTSQTGPGKILYRGPIPATIPVLAGVTPQLTPASALSES
jgi:hypothetical protein